MRKFLTTLGVVAAIMVNNGCSHLKVRIGVIGNAVGVAWKSDTQTNKFVLTPGVNVTNIISGIMAAED